MDEQVTPPEQPVEPQQPVITSETPPPAPTPEEPKKKLGKKRLALIIAGIILIAAGIAYYLYSQNKPKPAATTTTEATSKVAGPVWSDPQKIADPGIFTDLKAYYNGDYDPSTQAPEFYKVGAIDGKDIILTSVQCGGPCASTTMLFLNDSADHYLLLAKHSLTAYDAKGKYTGPALASKVATDDTTSYADIAYQPTIKLDKGTITNTNKADQLFTAYQANANSPLTAYAKTSYGQVYVRTLGKGDGFEVQEFILRRPDGTAVSYQSKPSFVGDDNVPAVTWSSGSANKDAYRNDGIGSCGSANGLAVVTANQADVTAAGKTSKGEPVYEFSDPNNATVTYFYNQYAYDQGKRVPGTVSFATYKANHGVFVYKDSLGRSIAFSNTKYASLVECGKPVIYLYPTKPTSVSVVVDALITKSEPAYNTGWKAFAQPNGQLTVNGKPYDSLFWEGTGKEYPTIDSGFIVKQADLKTTIPAQLKQLGLNAKEAADFQAFWMPKMPKTPFVRLTWFGTKQMDALAPLHVTPQPDTTIRIFLDFEGLNAPVSLPSQRLSAPARHGFTLVEWGGLLRTPRQ